MLEYSKSTLLYSLYNKFAYSECKMNFEWVSSYFIDKNQPNKLYSALLNIINDYKYEDVTTVLLELTMTNIGISNTEYDQIMQKILLYRSYNYDQMKPILAQIKKSAYNSYCKYATQKCGGDEEQFVELCKKYEYRSDYSDTIATEDFSQLDISNLLVRYFPNGYKSCMKFINDSYTINEFITGQLIEVIAAPGTGKSLYLENEAVEFVNQGKRVHIIALGDLTKLDFVIRMLSIKCRLPKWEVERNIGALYEANKSMFASRLGVSVVPSGVVTPTEYLSYIRSSASNFDVYMIDYDSNFKRDPNLSMYDQGGDLYDKLTTISGEGKLVFIASQPRREYFRAEEIPGDSSGESSRKYHIADMVITYGRYVDSMIRMGYATIDKSRRGDKAYKVPWIGSSEGKFYESSTAFYLSKRNDKNYRHYNSFSELEGMDLLDANLSLTTSDSLTY